MRLVSGVTEEIGWPAALVAFGECHPGLSPQAVVATERSVTAAAALEGGERLVECAGDAWEVPAVDETTVKLAAQLAEETDPLIVPGSPRGRLRCWVDDDPLDDLHGGAARGGRAVLLPRTVPAGRRAPLRDRASGPEGDRPPHQPHAVAAARRAPAAGASFDGLSDGVRSCLTAARASC
jgi:hypothetical protein